MGSVIDAVKLCGIQTIPLRRQREEGDRKETNCRNFVAIIDTLSHNSKELGEVLERNRSEKEW